MSLFLRGRSRALAQDGELSTLFLSIHLKVNLCACECSSFSRRCFVHLFVIQTVDCQGVNAFIIVFALLNFVAKFDIPLKWLVCDLQRRLYEVIVDFSI